MRLVIDTNVLSKENLSIKELGILLYYSQANKGVIEDELLENLYLKGYLCKEVDGYSSISCRWNLLCHQTFDIDIPEDKDLLVLAVKLMSIVPQTKIGNGPYYYKCNKNEVLQHLRKFHSIYRKSDNSCYTDNEIIYATEDYVQSFNNDFTRMVSLKNFICRFDRDSLENSSILASYLENYED